mgnify:CR=1 FL=1
MSLGFFSSFLTLIFAFVCTFLPFSQRLMGYSLPVLTVPIFISAIGSGVCFLYLIFGTGVLRNKVFSGTESQRISRLLQFARFFAILGLINWLSFIAADLLEKRILNSDKKSKRRYRGLLVLPILLAYGMLATFIVESANKGHVPLSWRGRNGLTFWETLWDVDVFWGEIWFNLMIILLITAFLLIKFNPKNRNAWSSKLTESRVRKIVIKSWTTFSIILIAMATTWDPWFSIAANWYPTQFAYQLPAWPVLIGVAGLFVFGIGVPVGLQKTNDQRSESEEDQKSGLDDLEDNYRVHEDRGVYKVDSSSDHTIPLFSWILMAAFLAIWFYLCGITIFHPHALLDIGMPLYYIIMTAGFPISFIVYLIQRNKRQPENSEEKRYSVKTMLIFTALTVIAVVMVVIVQHYTALLGPVIGSETAFGFTMDWTWPLSHWSVWVFDVSAIFGLYFGVYYFYGRKTGEYAPSQEYPGLDDRPHFDDVRILNPIRKKSTRIILASVIIVGLIVPPTLIAAHQWDEMNDPMILVNQVGYYPNSPKRALFQAPDWQNLPDTSSYLIINDSDGSVVYESEFKKNVSRYGFNYMMAEFSDLTSEGSFHIESNVNGRDYTSHSFEIASDVYQKAIDYNLRFFYYQRCNYEVDPVIAGYQGHAACHMSDAEVWNGTNWVYENLTGGWHDAGDYNKYNSWFQTQWYCDQAITEAILLDPNHIYSSLPSLYDSALPDAIDEALWGGLFLIHSVNERGLQGEEYKYRVWETVSGYKRYDEKASRMGYWGPPEMDYTSPRRVSFNEWGSTFCGWHRGYDIAASLMQLARMIDNVTATYPNEDLPSWMEWDTGYIRQLAENVYNKYLSVQGSADDDVQSYIGKWFYLEEKGIADGNDWSQIDALVPQLVPLISDLGSYPLWFGWASHYLFGMMLRHYITFDRPIPASIQNKITSIQENHFTDLFDEPFRVKHSIINGSSTLFYGAERTTDMITSAWLQSLMMQVDFASSRPEIVQSMLDWIFGLNPSGICMMEGLGDRNLYQYHHRYASARNPTGAVPGALPKTVKLIQPTNNYAAANGFPNEREYIYEHFGDLAMVRNWPANPMYRDGAPSDPDEVWIPHNAMLMRLFTNLAEFNPLL